MLAHTPNGVAVEGSAPDAAAAARWHIGRCEDEAVAAAIEALAAGEWPFA
jgi:hydroxymethylpyrimidine pyrophosphatase-like HAD family hydrolase